MHFPFFFGFSIFLLPNFRLVLAAVHNINLQQLNYFFFFRWNLELHFAIASLLLLLAPAVVVGARNVLHVFSKGTATPVADTKFRSQLFEF